MIGGAGKVPPTSPSPDSGRKKAPTADGAEEDVELGRSETSSGATTTTTTVAAEDPQRPKKDKKKKSSQGIEIRPVVLSKGEEDDLEQKKKDRKAKRKADAANLKFAYLLVAICLFALVVLYSADHWHRAPSGTPPLQPLDDTLKVVITTSLGYILAKRSDGGG